VEQAKVAIKEFWGDDPQKSNSLSRIVNASTIIPNLKHFGIRKIIY